MNKTKRILRFIPMIIIMITIYLFSCMQGDDSSEQSGRILQALVKIVESISSTELSEAVLGFLHLFIRKVAHFTEYAALGASIMYAIHLFFTNKKYAFALSLLLAALYAATDEIHQYFVPGRYGTWSDVLIDTAGALAGIMIFVFVIYSHHGKRDE